MGKCNRTCRSDFLKSKKINQQKLRKWKQHNFKHQAINQSLEKAKQLDINANITVLDSFGHLKSFLRMDVAYFGSIDVAIGKAKTAMLFRMNSEAVGKFLNPENKTHGKI